MGNFGLHIMRDFEENYAMSPRKHFLAIIIVFITAAILPGLCMGQSIVSLPGGMRAVWDVDKAFYETTLTRERICINGLWQWQPARTPANKVPTDSWGYYKVPGPWPMPRQWMLENAQTVHAHPSWKSEKLTDVTMAWYQREIAIPKGWGGRRIAIYTEYLNSYAAVYLDGIKAGEIHFPGGEVDITSVCRPGSKHVLTFFTMAAPLKAAIQSFSDTGAPKQVKGKVTRRGLCGDVFLVSTPARARIGDVKVDTSVRKWQIAVDAALHGLEAGKAYRLLAQVKDHGRVVKNLKSKLFETAEFKNDRFVFSGPWKPTKLWDVHTPGNIYHLELSLLDSEGEVLDVFQPVRFGFRELWIDGRDFRLNGTRFSCFVVPLDNGQISAETATYAAARESFERLKAIGVNLMYTHNYGCEPGSHLSFEEILRAADDVGMLISLSQPHFGHYDWNTPNADKTNGYARHAEFYVRMAQNHPSVVMYSMNHNSIGYKGASDPDHMDGLSDKRSWFRRNAKHAGQAEEIVQRFDQTRPIYHHSSGNMNQMYTLNFYLNFVPIQERSDWFEHWATKGVKPMFLTEYGTPLGYNWSMYRGWYKNKRSYGTDAVPWELCVAEWNAQFLGDTAYALSEIEKQKLRFEAEQWRAGKLFYRWNYPDGMVGSQSRHHSRDTIEAVWAMYITDNWRAFRTWGLSAFNSWHYPYFWTLRKGVGNSRKTLKVDWDNLQRPGFSIDFVQRRYIARRVAHERGDWIPSLAAKALIRNNQPLLAYIGGKPGTFTEKGHNFLPGERVNKQLIIINNSRRTVDCEYSWTLDLPQPITGSARVSVDTGEKVHIPLKLVLPDTLNPGRYDLSMTVKFSSGETQEDVFGIHVLPRPTPAVVKTKIALFDPKGESAKLLEDLGISYDPVSADIDLAPYDMLIVGKQALAVDGVAPDIRRVRDGLKVLIFEQTADVLERRFGFRVQEYGLRRVFKRVPDHPLLAGLDNGHLRDWQGEATLLPPRIKAKFGKRGLMVRRSGIEQTRAFRAGCRGNVASVLIEKPARGDFLPVVDGGFSLQYSPLLEYREGAGLVLFCQMDVTERTQRDPAAQRLANNTIRYVSAYSPGPRRSLVYVGNEAGRSHLESTGMRLDQFNGALDTGQVLVVTPGGGNQLAGHKEAITAWLKKGGHLLAVGLEAAEANAFMPLIVNTNKAEHISVVFESKGMESLLAGIGPADVNMREPREIDLVSGGATPLGNGVLAVANRGKVVFCQIAPWQFPYERQYNLKRTFRLTSVLINRLLGNMGAGATAPVLERFTKGAGGDRSPWLTSFYLDKPEEMDDPYRFFGW
jgi:hypothetical protein